MTISKSDSEYADPREHLEDELLRLDLRIQLALLQMRPPAPGAASGEQLTQRLSERSEEIRSRLAATRDQGGWLPAERLASVFGLAGLDVEILLIALAPEVDANYERLFAALQEDVTRRLASAELVAQLLGGGRRRQMEVRRRLSAGGALLRWRLVRYADDAPQAGGSAAASRPFHVDPRIADLLLGEPALDPRLAGHLRFLDPDELPVPQPMAPGRREELTALGAFLAGEEGHRRPVLVHLTGPDAASRRRSAVELGGALGFPVFALDLARLQRDAGGPGTAWDERLGDLLREVLLLRGCLCAEGLDELPEALREPFLERLAETFWLSFVTARQEAARPIAGARLLRFDFPLPDAAGRAAVWRRVLAGDAGDAGGEEKAQALAARFRLDAEAIEGAAREARDQVMSSEAGGDGGGSPVPLEALARACQAQIRHRLSSLARRVEPLFAWEDLVLPDDVLEEVRDLCRRHELREEVYGAGGFSRRVAGGRGLSGLFAGPSGTGKTMTAAVIARELGLELYRIDLAAVVSRYVGETEKNLEQVFAAAEDADVILFFDEADALFGKRTELKDAHDRYANIEVSYLLQRLETFAGLAILATNLLQNMDEAFVRRLGFILRFPFPDRAERERLWRQIFPPETRLADDVDLAALAEDLEVAGGEIRNIALSAAFRAAARGEPVAMADLIAAARAEYRKMGKTFALGTEPTS